MANKDTPHGFSFAYTLHGGPPSLRKYPSGTGTNGVYAGDIVITSTSGVEPKSTGTDWDKVLHGNNFVVGVAASYSASGVATPVWVYDDLANTVFTAQCETTDVVWASSAINQMYATTWAVGSTITGKSVMEIATDTTGLHVRILGMVDIPNNSTADGWQEVYCVIASPGGDAYIYGSSTK